MRSQRQKRNRVRLIAAASVLTLVIVVAAFLQRRAPLPLPNLGTSADTVRSRRSEPAPARAAPRQDEPKPSPTAERPGPPAEGENPNEVTALIARWRDTMARGDLQGHLACYAPVLDRYFRFRNVSKEEVEKDKRRMLRKWPRMTEYEVDNMKVTPDGDGTRSVTFRKRWEARNGKKRFAGVEDQRLTLKQIDGAWRIAGEEELKVYRVSRR